MTAMPSTTPMWPKVLKGVLPLLLIGGLSGWWFVVRETSYYLETGDARGVQPGDPVLRSGVRVGEVVGVKTSEDGAVVEFRLAEGEKLRFDDLVRVHRGLMAATAEVQLTRGCATPGSDAKPVDVPLGRVIQEAGRLEVLATRARCSEAGRQLEAWFQQVELEQAVESFRRAADDLLQRSGEALEEGRDLLAEKADELIKRLEESGMTAKADSIRQIVRERLRG